MDQRVTDVTRERSRRPVRNKRYNRRVCGEEKRPTKRLFTPEIKRFLKDWLVRRRDNPYPNRDEKKSLSIQTGLTYIQICNWFANWRRKLKNAGKEPQRKTWGHLIKSYNSQVQGNVEHFSICSDDSIWHEMEANNINYESNKQLDPQHRTNNLDPLLYAHETNPLSCQTNKCTKPTSADHCYTSHDIQNITYNDNNNSQAQCFYVSSTTENDAECSNPFSLCANKYKNLIMEKYLRDCQKPENYSSKVAEVGKTNESVAKPSMISKWLESAAKFKPSEYNYLNWNATKSEKKRNKRSDVDADVNNSYQIHGREELDAAEALTTLANAHSSWNM